MKLNEILKLGTGLITGDKAATIYAAGGVAKVQNTAGLALQRLGNSLSTLISPAVFKSLNDGAVKTADSDLNAATGAVIGNIPMTYKLLGLAAIAGLVWYFMRRR